MDPFEVLVKKDLSKMDIKELEKIFLKREDGRILFLGRIPLASLYATFMASVYVELEKLVGKAARGLILTASKNGGHRAGRAIRRRYIRRYGDLDRERAMMIARNMITIWGMCFGWGRFKMEEDGDVVRFIVEDSFEATGFVKLKEKKDMPVCWMLLGYIWGLLEGLLDCKVEGEEKMCMARGEKFCLFEYRINI